MRFDSAAPHVGMIGNGKLEAGRLVDRCAGLVDHSLTVHRHLTGQDECARTLSRRHEASLDHQHIEAHLFLAITLNAAQALRESPSLLVVRPRSSRRWTEPALFEPLPVVMVLACPRSRRPSFSIDRGRRATDSASVWHSPYPCRRS